MPTTSPEPDDKHKHYWMSRLTLPVDDPFWYEHYPGDRWNCKCSLEATDDPVLRPADIPEDKPQRGLDTNAGKTGEMFSQSHPYFPKDCAHCFARANSRGTTVGSIKNRLLTFFNAGGKKDCFNCPFIDECVDRPEEKKKITDAKFAKVKDVKDNNLMPIQGDASVPSLLSGTIHRSGKSLNRFLKHAHHDYDVDAAVYAWNNPSALKNPKVSVLGEGKDMTDPDDIANVQKKIDRSVSDYVVYEMKYGGRVFHVKLERLVYNVEQFYAIMEK